MRRFWSYSRKYLGFVALIVIVAWAARGAEVSIANIVSGVPNILDYLGRMIPPSGSILSKLWQPLAETFQIAIMAIIFATIVALPVSFLAARNIMSNEAVYQVTRAILGVLRGIPPLLYALLFVSMVGLENINPEIMNAAKASGANKVKTIVHVIIPETSALILGYILYYFEYNVRTGTVLGLVGAGGIGLQLMVSIHLFKYAETATILLLITAVIIIMDRLSMMARIRLIRGEATL